MKTEWNCSAELCCVVASTLQRLVSLNELTFTFPLVFMPTLVLRNKHNTCRMVDHERAQHKQHQATQQKLRENRVLHLYSLLQLLHHEMVIGEMQQSVEHAGIWRKVRLECFNSHRNVNATIVVFLWILQLAPLKKTRLWMNGNAFRRRVR